MSAIYYVCIVVIILFVASSLFLFPAIRYRLIISRSWVRACSLVVLIACVLGCSLAIENCFFTSDSLISDDLRSNSKTPPSDSYHALAYFFSTFANDMPRWEAMDARHIFCFIVGLVGFVLISCFAISFVVNEIHSLLNDVKNGCAKCGRLRGHYVVIGARSLLESVLELIESKIEGKKQRFFFSAGIRIVVMTSESVPDVRRRLAARLTDNQLNRIALLHGGMTCLEDLNRLQIPWCREIFILGEAHDINRDDVNIECTKIISDKGFKEWHKRKPWACVRWFMPRSMVNRWAKRRVARKICRVLFDRHTTYSLFFREQSTKFPHIVFEPYCFYTNWAEKVFCSSCHSRQSSQGDDYGYSPLDRIAIGEDSQKFVHLVVVGMSQMGITLAMEAAQMLHFPNFITQGIRSRITFIDRNAKDELKKLQNRLPFFFAEIAYTWHDMNDTGGLPRRFGTQDSFIDLEFSFVQGNVEDERVRELLTDYAKDDNALVTLAVCVSNPNDALSIGLSLPVDYYVREIPVLIRQERGQGMSTIVKNIRGGVYQKVMPFGMLDEDAGIAEENDRRAMIVKSIYEETFREKNDSRSTRKEEKGVTYGYHDRERIEQAAKKALSPEREGAWRCLLPWEKCSNRYNARTVGMKLRSIGAEDLCKRKDWCQLRTLLLEKADMLAQVEHNRWNVEKLLMGYRPAHVVNLSCVLRNSSGGTVLSREEQNIENNMELSFRQLLKKKMIHPDIVPYNMLPRASKACDINLSLYLYLIVKEAD